MGNDIVIMHFLHYTLSAMVSSRPATPSISPKKQQTSGDNGPRNDGENDLRLPAALHQSLAAAVLCDRLDVIGQPGSQAGDAQQPKDDAKG